MTEPASPLPPPHWAGAERVLPIPASVSGPGLAAGGQAIHVVGYGEDAGIPILLASPAFGEPPSPLALEGRFAWRISGTRTCIGRWDRGSHVPCPTQQPVAGDFVCLSCSGVEVPECVFEPRCASDPTTCQCTFGPVPHVVYIAFYGPLSKVGMTQEWRLAARLREQGADAYFVAARCSDRGTARNVERKIAFVHGIPEFRGPREVLPQLVRPVEWDVIEERAASVAQRVAASHGPPGPLRRITDHPVQAPLPAMPRRVATHGEHSGTWLGAKGQNLFYREALAIGPGAARQSQARLPWSVAGGAIRARVAAIKRSDLLGRTVTVLPGGGAASAP